MSSEIATQQAVFAYDLNCEGDQQMEAYMRMKYYRKTIKSFTNESHVES